ncbi:MAG TPA: DGQHR domain-containing protein [Solirubrobacterales bacterium]|jgi:hypothetical protein|nr:DGQHR domain-containing protein [Solirubrobacterales bacterium]
MTPAKKKQQGSEIAALKVRQWQPEWEQIDFDKPHRSKPDDHFFIFSIRASTLRALSGIQRRDASKGARRRTDLGIQRRHDEKRSEEISRFIRHGYPWSDLGKTRRESGEFDDLKQPGWLPTAIVVNIRTAGDEMGGATVDPDDLISIDSSEGGSSKLHLPIGADEGEWEPNSLHPIEVIDGQHRLWAFDAKQGASDYELPVVAFVGLDRTWQAYLFWTINIKPKRINSSLAFDLYPLLRHQDWLDRFEGPAIYRETRAQELTELMWSHEASPWYRRINMLGEKGDRNVRQAAWVRALLATYIRPFEGSRVPIGGLFGAPAGEDQEVLDWTREQQAAFLIFAWSQVERAVTASKASWTPMLRREAQRGAESRDEPKTTINADRQRAPFVSRFSLLATDQGLNGILSLTNDLAYLAVDELQLADWRAAEASEVSDQKAVSEQLDGLAEQRVATLLREIGDAIADFDWRTSGAPNLTDEERRRASVFRGTGGYRELRLQLHEHVAAAEAELASPLAAEAVKKLTRNR